MPLNAGQWRRWSGLLEVGFGPRTSPSLFAMAKAASSLVALLTCRDLLLRAKHLFVAAILAGPPVSHGCSRALAVCVVCGCDAQSAEALDSALLLARLPPARLSPAHKRGGDQKAFRAPSRWLADPRRVAVASRHARARRWCLRPTFHRRNGAAAQCALAMA